MYVCHIVFVEMPIILKDLGKKAPDNYEFFVFNLAHLIMLLTEA